MAHVLYIGSVLTLPEMACNTVPAQYQGNPHPIGGCRDCLSGGE